MILDLSELTDGFSSKLKVISYYIAVIEIRNLKKELFIYEKKTKEAPFLFTDLCYVKKFRVFKLKNKPKSEIIFNPYNHSIAINNLKKSNFIKDNQNSKFNSISELSYQNYMPKKIIKNKIKKIKLPKTFVSMHIRATDRQIKLKNFIRKIQFEEMIFDFQVNHMIRNIQNFINSKKLVKNVFICSDDNFYKKSALNLLSSKLSVFQNRSKFNKNKFRQTNGIDFVTELFCLSKSQSIISTVGGAVTQSAYLISGKKIKVYKWTDLKNFFYLFKFIILSIYILKKIKNFLKIQFNNLTISFL